MAYNRSPLQASATTGVTERILASIAEREGTDILSLPPLYDAVDPDALKALVDQGGVIEISFVYLGYDVLVQGDGQVSVSKLCDQTDDETPAAHEHRI